MTVSIGAATLWPRPGHGNADLIAAADRALYAAKVGGRDRVVPAGRQVMSGLAA